MKKGFTLVELLAVIVILAVILVIAVPRIMDMIEQSKKSSLESSTKLVASTLETDYQSALASGRAFSTSGDCISYVDVNEYNTCIYTISDSGEATVTLAGKDGGKFDEFYASGTKTAVIVGSNDNNPNLLYNIIKSQAVDATIDFKVRSGVSNTNGIYITNKTQNDITVYYYRGNVSNHVIFNDICWRIVRTTETGGVKLIYNGKENNGKCTATGASTQIGTSKFNDYANDNAYMGYMYGTANSNTYEATHANTNDSAIKVAVDAWYKENFVDKNSNLTVKIEDTVYCNDRSMEAYNSSKFGYSGFSSYDTKGYGLYGTLFSPSVRVNYWSKNPSPTLVCLQENDRFTVSDTNGNGKLTYPVGLLTSDEIILAGFNTYASNSGSYMDTNNYLYTGTDYWLMSPIYIWENKANVGSVCSAGHTGGFAVNSLVGVRPVISLVHSVIVSSGDGTMNSPYVIK